MSNIITRTDSGVPFKSPKRGKWIATGVAVVVVLGLGASVAIRAASASSGIPMSDIYQVSAGTTVSDITTTGTIESSSQSNLGFQNVGGTIKTLNVDVGAHVKAGEVLATLDDASMQVQIAQAQAGVAEAQGNLAQAQTALQTAQSNQQAGVTAAQKQLEAAQSALQTATQNLSTDESEYGNLKYS